VPPGVVHRQDEAFERREFRGDRVARVGGVGGEGHDTALARHVSAEHRDRADGSHGRDLPPSAQSGRTGRLRAVATPDDRYGVDYAPWRSRVQGEPAIAQGPGARRAPRACEVAPGDE
jgi:hypothetical protein